LHPTCHQPPLSNTASILCYFILNWYNRGRQSTPTATRKMDDSETDLISPDAMPPPGLTPPA
ncbi:hypothetical protein NG796_26190, partial [Laspinema sp. A4]|uniref:hypothetical protein n=1 Tax=Laspinema sp. D2d TaxID=2953686 RepID=UPI0021BA5891